MYVYNLYQEYLSTLDSGISENYNDNENDITTENVKQNTDKHVVLVDFNEYQSAGKIGTNKKIADFYNNKLNTRHKYTYRVKKTGSKHTIKRKRLRTTRSKTKKKRTRK